MASSELQIDIDILSSKIDKAFSLWSETNPDADIDEQAVSEFTFCTDLLNTYIAEATEDPVKFMDINEYISSSLFDHIRIVRSKLLDDQKLLEALTYSKIFDNFAEFDTISSLYKCELVWVRGDQIPRPNEKWILPNQISHLPRPGNLLLIFRNQIIYHINSLAFAKIRQRAQESWAFFRNKAKTKLIEALTTPDCHKIVSHFQSLSIADFAPPLDAKYTMTEEVRRLMLNELNTLHLDPRVKQRFIFDLKVLPDKDIHYWRDRLDCLRFISSRESQESQKLIQAIANLEKILSTSVAVEPTLTVADALQILNEILAHQESQRKTMDEEMKANGEKLQQLIDSISTLGEAVKYNENYLTKFAEKKADESTSTELDRLSAMISDLKNLNFSDSHPKVGSWDEQKLSELFIVLDNMRVSIQNQETGLPSIQQQIKTLQEAHSSILSKVEPLTQSVQILQEEVKSSIEGTKRSDKYLEAMAKKMRVRIDEPEKTDQKSSTPEQVKSLNSSRSFYDSRRRRPMPWPMPSQWPDWFSDIENNRDWVSNNPEGLNNRDRSNNRDRWCYPEGWGDWYHPDSWGIPEGWD